MRAFIMIHFDLKQSASTTIILLLVMAWGAPALHAAMKETLFHKINTDGSVFFQIQNTKKGAEYSIQLTDPISGKQTALIENLTKGAVPHALRGDWKPPVKKQLVCQWSILRDGEHISPKLSPLSMPEKFSVTPGKIKRSLNGITWSQDTPAISRVFVANRSGMLIAWVKPWGFSGVGSHLTQWNFKDMGKVRSYRSDSDIHAFVQTVPLGKRWIVIGDVKFDAQYAASKPFSKIKLPKIPYDFNLSLPGAKLAQGTSGKADAIYHAHAGMPVRVSLDTESKKKMGGRRFEILLFLNGEFIHEEAQGVDPYTFILPNFPGVTGKHHFTVNIIDYHGNIASKTLAIQFESNLSSPTNSTLPAASE